MPPSTVMPSPQMPRNRLWVVVQILFGAAVAWFAGRALATEWSGVRALLADARPKWTQIALSAVPVVVAYALLIHVWRAMLAEWRESAGTPLSYREAARIWFVSNLGRYVPGKIWQIATMSVMAQRRGVSPVAATGSSLIVNLANIASGFVIVLATGAVVFGAFAESGPRAGLLLAGILTAGLVLLPAIFSWISPLVAQLTRQRVTLPRIPARVVFLAALGTAAAWLLYGVAFQVFSGSLVRATGATHSYIAAYTASYLIGYLALFTPGGLVVREAMLVASLTTLGLLTAPEAWLVAIASRLWLTVLEIGPGLLFLLLPGERS